MRGNLNCGARCARPASFRVSRVDHVCASSPYPSRRISVYPVAYLLYNFLTEQTPVGNVRNEDVLRLRFR